ncbi:MAG TPA: oxygen-dependent coproporphyrinogen oxidase [Nitrospiria bacterium]|nr:oxygen-dependent coproporphyrinogen oxidase [Nitrospiria bacterium]
MAMRQQMERYTQDLRDRICRAFEALDTAKFEQRVWQREGGGGGGVMSVMRGTVFEKVGVNCSSVWGDMDPEMAAKLQSKTTEFFATGVSLVAHMANPLVPAVHMNVRYLEMDRWWFGGGTDLTPYYPFEEDTRDFHAALQQACDRHDPSYYPRFKKWCDEYFFLPHRNEPRGVGGIFFDYLNDRPAETLFAFVREVGDTFARIYPEIVARRKALPFTPEQRKHQLQRRGRYVEFNLIYDRGTLFGLKTKGDVEAILMSMPPVVTWP